MSGFSSKLARVTRDFTSNNPVELSLAKDDVIRILSQIDRHWISVFFNGHTALFPSDYVVEMDNFRPSTNAIFVAIDDFVKIEPGDLSFLRGNILEGVNQHDDNWWNGRIVYDSKRNQKIGTNETEIFPVTHVYR